MLVHYLAYGSNLHPLRLQERVPSARLIGTIRQPGYELSFLNKSFDGSSKCTLRKAGMDRFAMLALYSMKSTEKAALDAVEGSNKRYLEETWRIRLNQESYEASIYISPESRTEEQLKPYQWYKGFVEAGAEYLDFPEAYIAMIRAVESVPDPDETRRAKNSAILSNLHTVNRESR